MIHRYVGIEAMAGLTVLAAMSGSGVSPRKSHVCRYREFCGPPYPTTRQQYRAAMRAAKKALAAIKSRTAS